MLDLKSKELLFIVPHYKVFIKDQATLIRKQVGGMTILMPMLRFHNMAVRLPLFSKYYSFLNLRPSSVYELPTDCKTIFPKFMTLPIEPMRKRKYYVAAKNSVKELSGNNSFNLIHAHFLDIGLIGATIKNLYSKPFVVTAHGGELYDLPFRNEYYRNLIRYVLNEADQIIAVSNSNAKIIKSLGISPRKINVIPNGFDEKMFKIISQSNARNKLGLPQEKKIILSVGNLVKEKGHTYLIDAMCVLLKKRSDVLLAIIGSGSLRKQLQKKIKMLGLDDKIIMFGQKPHEEISTWMNASDLFVLSSLNEGFPTVIPEALACGKPVIGTKVGGVPEILPNSDIGFLVNAKNQSELADAMLTALEKKWCSSIITDYAKDFAWTRLVKHILNVYSVVLSSNRDAA